MRARDYVLSYQLTKSLCVGCASFYCIGAIARREACSNTMIPFPAKVWAQSILDGLPPASPN